jgi:hypothetical protein
MQKKTSNSLFEVSEIEYLGYWITRDGIQATGT